MDDSPGMAVIETIDKLEKEQFDLIGSYGLFELGQIFFEIIVH